VTEVSAGGPVAIAGGTSQGVIFSASDKAGNVLLQVNDSTTVGTAILASDVAATGSAQNIEFVAQAGSYGGGDRLTSWWNGGTELGYAENYGNNGFGFRGINANMGYRNSNADGLITASNNVYIDTQGSHSLYISSSGVGSNSGTYVGLVGIFPYGDGNQVSGISGAAWKYVDSYYYTSAGSVTCTVQTAAGSTATCAIVGTPTSWKVSVTTSGSGIATGDQVKVNFGSNFGAAPKCIVSAAVQATAAFQPFIDYASTTSSATYVGVGSTPSGTIQFTGICIQ
jgi:hypothetical protein